MLDLLHHNNNVHFNDSKKLEDKESKDKFKDTRIDGKLKLLQAKASVVELF